MPAAITDKFTSATNSSRPAATTLTALHSGGDTIFTCNALTGWPTNTAVHFIVYTIDTSGNKVAGSQTDWKGVVSGNTLTNCQLKAGTDSGYSIGAIVECSPTAYWAKDLTDGLLVEHDQDGTHGSITAASANVAGTVTANAGVFNTITVSGTATSQGWTALGQTPASVTYNGYKNYDVVFNSVDLSSTLSTGMKLQLTRNTAAPIQCANFNGTTQYFTKSSPAGMTFTNNFVVMGWVKLTSYPAAGATIASRFNGTSGWQLYISSVGQIKLDAFNGGTGNYFAFTSYTSIPLNKWVHIAVQTDMTNTTNDGSNNYCTINGTDAAVSIGRAGTNPTSLVQAGDFQIGASNGTNLITGKLAQVAVFSQKITQATIRSYISQTLSGSETGTVSSYSLSGSVNDLNANANNLTAQGGITTTTSDSPFGNGGVSSTLEYAEINSVTYLTNTTVNVRVPDTCMIPTSGTISSVNYTVAENPYGLPYFGKILGYAITCQTSSSTTASAYVDILALQVPVYVPTNAQIKIRLYSPRFAFSATAGSSLTIREGSTGLAATVRNGNHDESTTTEYVGYQTQGAHTYKASMASNTAGTLTFYGSKAASTMDVGPAYLTVELI